LNFEKFFLRHFKVPNEQQELPETRHESKDWRNIEEVIVVLEEK